MSLLNGVNSLKVNQILLKFIIIIHGNDLRTLN